MFGSLLLAASLVQGGEEGASSGSGGMGDSWTVVGNVPSKEFKIQLHRSAGKFRPENTLESCEYALELGTITEVDLRPTSDGIIVAFHDANFKRVVKK
jgi:glycerophosphoryl diester phosphodiesterase